MVALMENYERDDDITEQSEMAVQIELDMASRYADIRCLVATCLPSSRSGPRAT